MPSARQTQSFKQPSASDQSLQTVKLITWNMGKETEIIRPFLFAVRLALLICAVIVLGLTAWSAERLKGYRVIFTLVIVSILTDNQYIFELALINTCYTGGVDSSILYSLSFHRKLPSQSRIFSSTRYNFLRAVRQILRFRSLRRWFISVHDRKMKLTVSTDHADG